VGAVVAILIIGAVATLGYYQIAVAPGQASSSSTSTIPSVVCPSAECANVTMPNGASTQPSGYTAGAKTTYGFSPDVVIVVIGKNNTVYWTNDDVAEHTATSDTAGIFDSGVMSPGSTFQYTFTTPGTYTYHCSLHPWMQGSVIVKAGQASGSTSSTSSTSSSRSSTTSTNST
jgi:plastocyanin